MIKAFLRPVAVALSLAFAASIATAQAAYPAKPLHINVGAPAGGGTDVVARLLADKMGPLLGQSIIVDNRPGAANTIAADMTARAPGDGYTLLTSTNSPQVIAPHLMKLNYDPLRQLTPVGMVLTVPHVLIVNADSPYKSLSDVVAAIKAKPGALRYATSGMGSVQHMAAELFMAATDTQMIHVPYKGSSQAHQDILANQVEMMLDTSSSAMALIKSGKFRALAVTTAKRSGELPDVPTLDESGIKNAEMSTWYALYVPATTSAPVLDRLTGELVKTLKMPEVQTRLKGLGGEPATLTREQFVQQQASDFQRFGQLIKQRNIQLN